MSLSDRVRLDIDAAPWVIAGIVRLESELAETKVRLDDWQTAACIESGTSLSLRKTISAQDSRIAQYSLESVLLAEIQNELAETKRKLEEEKQRGFSMSAEIEDMLIKLEAAEQRIRESQEQEPVGDIINQFEPEHGVYAISRVYKNLPVGSKLYAIPPIPNTEKE